MTTIVLLAVASHAGLIQSPATNGPFPTVASLELTTTGGHFTDPAVSCTFAVDLSWDGGATWTTVASATGTGVPAGTINPRTGQVIPSDFGHAFAPTAFEKTANRARASVNTFLNGDPAQPATVVYGVNLIVT